MIKDIYRDLDKIQLDGIIIPTAWQENGTPIAWGLSAVDEVIYQIDMENEAGRELKKLLKKKIKITGQLTKKGQHQKEIKVHSFTILEDPLPEFR